jgi:Leucine-rich repeat (LRR) protein
MMKTLLPGFCQIRALFLFILLLTADIKSISAQTAVTSSDSLALVALYNATEGQNWTHNENWLTGTVSNWWGITTEDCNVIKIQLYNNNLKGFIPADIGNMRELQWLWLFGNQLSGKIPPETVSLTKLQTLNFSDNQLSGSIPSEIGNLTSLNYLDLGYNQLEGKIPSEIWNLKNLEELLLSQNQLTGEIPAEIENLSCLTHLILDRNEFTGIVPREINNLTDLRQIYLDNNFFTEIPDLSKFLSIYEITCFYNHLTFEDFEQNLTFIHKSAVQFEYSPQLPFGLEYDTTVTEKEPFSLSIPCGGSYNHYKWFKDGNIVATAPDASTLTIPAVSFLDAGRYYITVTNDSVPNLELTSLPVTLTVEKGLPEELKPVNLVILDGSRNTFFMIENVEDYPDNNLVVFSISGNKIYQKQGYNNDLDFGIYPEGTYYYILTIKLAEGQKQFKSFVDVVRH